MTARPARRAAPFALFLSLCVALVTSLALSPPPALAAPPAAGVQKGKPKQAAHSLAGVLGARCEGEGVVEETLNAVTIGAVGDAKCAAQAAGELTGGALSAAGNSILDGVARWMIGASTALTEFVAKEMRETTTPQLGAAWYMSQFAPLADLGAGLGLLVAVLSLASAALRRDPRALAGTLTGIVRAGLGTGLVLALTSLGLDVADEVSGAVLAASPHAFWRTVAHAWGTSGFGGFESSALAMLVALVEIVFGLFVWLELVARDAAIYIAVLFFPVVLAASIWPALGSWTSRLARLELLVVVLKPVALIVLSLAGAAAAGGLSLSGGLSGSAGTILVGIVIFALAAFAPWALMYLLAADAESAYAAAGTRHAAASSTRGAGARARSAGGGLRNLGGSSGGGVGSPTPFGAGGGPRGFPSSSAASPVPGSPSGSAAPSGSGGPSAGGASSTGSSGTGGGELDEALPIGAAAIGAGGVGAAAGAAPPSTDDTSSQTPPASAAPSSSRAPSLATPSPSRAPASGAASSSDVPNASDAPPTSDAPSPSSSTLGASPPSAAASASAPARAPASAAPPPDSERSSPSADTAPPRSGAPPTAPRPLPAESPPPVAADTEPGESREGE